MELRAVLRLVSGTIGDEIIYLDKMRLFFRCELCQFKSFYTFFKEAYLEARVSTGRA